MKETLNQSKRTDSLKGILILLLTAIIWGSSFVAQSKGMEHIEAFTYSAVRMPMGSAVLLPYLLLRRRRLPREERGPFLDAKTLRRGVVLGVVFCIACNLQQHAFAVPEARAGKIAFITAFYMFFVPLLGSFLKKRVPLTTWLAVVAGLGGLWLLCVEPGAVAGGFWTSFNRADVLSLACALFFAVQILMIERFAADCDGIKLSFVEFLVGGVLSAICMLLFENPSAPAIRAAIVPLLYSGVMSCGLAYTFQIVGQKYTEATVASLIMCLESVFAVISSAILLRERLSPRELAGCGVMFAAILISQLADIRKNRRSADRETPAR